MTTANPVNSKNAIEAVTFIVSFGRALGAEEVKRLSGLESILKDELPFFNKMSSLSVGFSANNVQVTTTSDKGVTLQKVNTPNAKVSWLVRVETDGMQISCDEYTRWGEVWPKALQFFEAASSVLPSESLPIAVIGLQVVDKFVYENEPPEYDLNDVFQKDSPLLPKSLATSGKLWHLNQGWFEQSLNRVPSKTLIQFTASSAMNGQQLQAVIDATHQNIPQIQLPLKLILAKSDDGSSLLQDVVSDLHTGNKNLLKALVSDALLNKLDGFKENEHLAK